MRSIFFIAFLIFTNTVFSQAVNGVKTVNGVAANSSGEITISGGSGITLPQLTDSLNLIRAKHLADSIAQAIALNTKITSIVPGTNINVDNTDPANPIVSSTGGSTVTSYGKNTGKDSTILLMSNGTRYAAKDNNSGGGGTQAIIQYNDSIIAVGDSYVVGGAGPSSVANSHMEIIKSRYNLKLKNAAVNGTGVFVAIKQAYANSSALHTDNIFLMEAGFNDIRLSGINNKTFEKIKGSTKAFIANAFVSNATSANSLSKTGTWNSTSNSAIAAKSIQQMGGYIIYTQISGGKVTYNFTGDNLFVSYLGSDGSTIPGGTFTLTIDGVLKNTTTTFDKADGITDAAGNGNAFSNNGVYLSGLGSGSHTCVLNVTSLQSGGTVYIDYFGTLDAPTNVKPVFILNAPYMTAIGYSLGSPYNNGSNASIDSANVYIKSAVDEFVNYPISLINVNSVLNTTTMIAADNIHTNDLGAVVIAAEFSKYINAAKIPKSQVAIPTAPFTIIQPASGVAGLQIFGKGYATTSPTDNTNGISLTLGYNATGKIHALLGAADALGNSQKGVFRFQTGDKGFAIMDVASGDGGLRRLLTILGTDNSNVGIGINEAGTIDTAKYTAQLNVLTLNRDTANLKLQKFGTASGNYLEVRNKTDVLLSSIDNAGEITSIKYKLSALNTAPATSTSTGTTGEIRVTAGFIYVCTATNTWVRTALATW